MAHEVGSLVDHEAATLHPDGVATAEVRVKVCAVIAALIAPTLEVFVLVKDNLVENESKNVMSFIVCLLTCFRKTRIRNEISTKKKQT